MSNEQLVRKILGPSEMFWVELMLFFQNKVGRGKVKYGKLSGAELPRLIITYLLETSWINIEVSRKHFLLY